MFSIFGLGQAQAQVQAQAPAQGPVDDTFLSETDQKRLSKYEKIKGALFNEEMFLKKAADDMLTDFGAKLQPLGAAYVAIVGALGGIASVGIISGHATFFVVGIILVSYSSGFASALVMVWGKFRTLALAVESLEKRYNRFYSEAGRFKEEAIKNSPSASSVNIHSAVAIQTPSASNVSSPSSTSGLYGGMNLVPAKFRRDILVEKSDIDSLLPHNRRLIWSNTVLSAAQILVFTILPFIVPQNDIFGGTCGIPISCSSVGAVAAAR